MECGAHVAFFFRFFVWAGREERVGRVIKIDGKWVPNPSKMGSRGTPWDAFGVPWGAFGDPGGASGQGIENPD